MGPTLTAGTRYYARSASDKTDDWPFWFVADARRGGLNVTAELIRKHLSPDHRGGVLMLKHHALDLAQLANGEKSQ